jgi:membrane protease YdiL (CAAX protease family)
VETPLNPVISQSNPYLAAAEQGKNNWWRYLLGYLFILGSWLLLGSIPTIAWAVLVELDGNPDTFISLPGTIVGYELFGFIGLLLSFVPLFLSVLLVVRFLHGRPVRSLLTSAPGFRWERFFKAMLAWGLLAGVIALVEALLYPGRYALAFNAAELAPYILPALLLIPIQTSAEEFLMRGYIVQNVGLKIKNIWALSIISGIIFTLPHLWNPEMAVNALLVPLFYFSFGFFAAFISLKDGGLELALGVHAINNLFTLLINYTNSALPTPSVFSVIVLDPVYGLIAPILAMLVFYGVFFSFLDRRKKGK